MLDLSIKPPRARVALASLFFAVIAALPARPVHACSCMALTFEQKLEGATDVFEGRVTSIDGAAGIGTQGSGPEAHLTVVRTWKGADVEEVTLPVGDGANCGVMWEVGRSYLVYATMSEGTLNASICGGTARVEDAEAELSQLGAGVTPVDPAPANELREDDEEDGQTATVPPGSGGCAGCFVGGRATTDSAAYALLGLLGLVVWRARRRGQNA